MPKRTPEFVVEDLNGSRIQLFNKLNRSKGKGTQGVIVSEELLYNDG